MAELNWILLVEDSEDHRVLVRQALGRMAEDVPLLEAESGEEALEWMKRQVSRVGPLEGGLVIVDLGLPGISGFEVLQKMREIPGLEDTPVAVITASENAMDQDHAFNLGARGFFQKPTNFLEYQEILKRVMALKPTTYEEPGPT
jgi:CheY-like chemotaxis protein